MTMAAAMPAGFTDKVLAAQSTFRSVMDAMARPGRVQRIAASVGVPEPMMRGTAAVALTLFDHDTPIFLDEQMSATSDVATWIRFHTSAPVTSESAACSFAVIGDPARLPPLDRFSFGSDDYPDRSTTLLVQVDSLLDGPGLDLRGPGIDGTIVLRASPGRLDLCERLAINAALFPRGIDLILVADDAIVAIPRTTRLVPKGD